MRTCLKQSTLLFFSSPTCFSFQLLFKPTTTRILSQLNPVMDSKNPQSSQKWNKEAGENHDQPLPVYQLLEGIANYTGPPHTQWRPMNHQRSRSSGSLVYIPPSHKPSTLIVGERSVEPKLCEREVRRLREWNRSSPIPSKPWIDRKENSKEGEKRKLIEKIGSEKEVV